jgi:hypothetical protein
MRKQFPTLCLLTLLASASVHADNQTSAWCSAPPPGGATLKSLQADATHRSAAQPRAIAHLHTEGTLPHQGIWDQSMEAKKDQPLMRSLALSWRATHDAATLTQLAALLDAWSTIYQPSFNPIDETGFDTLIDAYAVSRDALPAGTREHAAALLRNWAAGYLQRMEHPATPGKGTWTNNWQSHRIKLATMAAVALDDAVLFDAARIQFRQQLNQNLGPDGASIDFAERDALHYTVYDLEPLVRAAMAARLRGEDWLTLRGDNGATLAKGLGWLLPYASGERTHEEYVHTTVKFDHQRRDAGVAGFSGPWHPQSSAALFWTAATLDARYRAAAQPLSTEPDWVSACWTIR